jgi:ligand-binding SRPBCC domain-containing protein
LTEVRTKEPSGLRGGVCEFAISSHLAAPSAIVWRHAVSPNGVNREFRPLLRMTFPDGIEDVTAAWASGKRLFRSWLLLGGVLPIDYDDLAFVEVEPGRRFLERSVLCSQRLWEHERVIEPLEHGCRVTDRIRFVPRLAWTRAACMRVFPGVFRLRHRNLRRLFGTVRG